MRCPVCRSGQTKVVDSRDSRDGSIRRRRLCNNCGHRFTTRERIDEALPSVVKRDGSREPFDRNKLLRGLQIACRKRPVKGQTLEEVVRAVEQWATTRGDRDIPAEEIGIRVMDHLHDLDEVAYVRFVSVHHSFNSIEEFESLLREMEKAQRVDIEGQRRLFEAVPDAEVRVPLHRRGAVGGAPSEAPAPATKPKKRKRAAGKGST